MVRTGTTIQQENSQLKSRGFAVGMLDESANKRTWYRLDGLGIPNLPCDEYHRMKYIGRGWSLTPPPNPNNGVAEEDELADDVEMEDESIIKRRKRKPGDAKNTPNEFEDNTSFNEGQE